MTSTSSWKTKIKLKPGRTGADKPSSLPVKELSRDGFSFVSIGIDFEYDPSTMYDHHVSMTDMSRLAPELGKMIKKAIMDNSKRQWK